MTSYRMHFKVSKNKRRQLPPLASYWLRLCLSTFVMAVAHGVSHHLISVALRGRLLSSLAVCNTQSPARDESHNHSCKNVLTFLDRVALGAQRPIVVKLSHERPAGPSVGKSAADLIRMPFGIVGRTGPRMRQVVGFGDRSTGRGTFGGEFGARHCPQGSIGRTCATAPPRGPLPKLLWR